MAIKTKSKPTASAASSWWAERSKILASVAEPKPARARPKIKKVMAKAKPKSIKAKKAVKAKKVTRMKKAGKAKKGKGKRTK
jgi:hypothetical protein